MNIIKKISVLLVKNHLDTDQLTKKDHYFVNGNYNRVSAIINASKLGEMKMEVSESKTTITIKDDNNPLTKNRLTIYHNHKHHKALMDFFKGLARTGNINGYLSFANKVLMKSDTRLSINRKGFVTHVNAF